MNIKAIIPAALVVIASVGIPQSALSHDHHHHHHGYRNGYGYGNPYFYNNHHSRHQQKRIMRQIRREQSYNYNRGYWR